MNFSKMAHEKRSGQYKCTPGAFLVRQNGKGGGWFPRRQIPKETASPPPPSPPLLATTTALIALTLLLPIPTPAGWVETTPAHTDLHLTLFDLPDPSRTDPATRAELAVQRAFLAAAPDLLRARQAADPSRYGTANLDSLALHLHRFSGIRVEGVESTLLAIAGNVAPDVLYVNFRQSDTYITQGFLHPLDLPEDAYYTALDPADIARRIHPKIAPVIRRPGADGIPRVWALPSEPPLGRVVLYRRDLFDAAGLPPPTPSWTWHDFYTACRRIADPANGIYALGLSRGKHESVLWMPFLWGAGGDALEFDPAANRWRAVFDTPQAADALDFYIRLTSEPWTDSAGRPRRGYAIKDTADVSLKWRNGQLGMIFSYIDQRTFTTLNPDLTGMVPLPLGPAGRGTEINSRMMGIFAGATNPLIRDAAWEYIRYQNSTEAAAIRVQHLVEGGFGRFLPPDTLRQHGYESIASTIPPEWRDCLPIALEDSRPEPYGKNANVIYDILTTPIRRAEELAHAGQLADDPATRRAQLLDLLRDARRKADADMLGHIPPRQLATRRAAAALLLLALATSILLVLRQMFRLFLPTRTSSSTPKGKDASPRRPDCSAVRLFARCPQDVPPPRRRPRRWLAAALLLLPAAATIALWGYIPLLRGAAMAFYDYRIFGASTWVFLDNFANLLWDPDWWQALLTSARYSFLVITMTFIPPVLLAILLQEVPRGKILFRLIFYLPATITGLVVILLWKTFYEPSEAGLMNRLVMHTPAAAWLLLSLAALLLTAHLTCRLLHHGGWKPALFTIAAGLLLAAAPLAPLRAILAAQATAPPAATAPLAWLLATLPEPTRWLDDSRTALFSCVLPMLWAGMGPGCLIYLAALKGIPDDLYEAADLDGASFTDKILFIVIPTLRPLLIINFVGVFIASWQAEANILAMTAGGARTEVAGLHIFYKAFIFLRLGPATAAAWMLGCLLVGFTLYQLRILSRVEFRANREATL
ncbi:MAG: extracellular solute-binding protein [Lentisphaerae bacterium]|nr:extracellular solute-binding protein [Lentisphaerota bacterium]